MKIIIEKCSNNNFWYRDKIGKEFDVIPYSKTEYELKNEMSFIMICDCKVVENIKTKPLDFTQLSNKELISKTLYYLDNITSIKRTVSPLTYEEVLFNLVIYEFIDRLQNVEEEYDYEMES